MCDRPAGPIIASFCVLLICSLSPTTRAANISADVATGQTLIAEFAFDSEQYATGALAAIGLTEDAVNSFVILVGWVPETYVGSTSELFDSTGALLDTDSYFPAENPPPVVIGVELIFDNIGDVFADRGGKLSFKNLGPPLSVTRIEFSARGSAVTPPTFPGGIDIGATITSWTIVPEPTRLWLLGLSTFAMGIRRALSQRRGVTAQTTTPRPRLHERRNSTSAAAPVAQSFPS